MIDRSIYDEKRKIRCKVSFAIVGIKVSVRVCVVRRGMCHVRMCLVKECSHKIKIEFEEIKRTATVKQLHLFCCDEAFTHQVGCIYVSSTKLLLNSLLSRNALSQAQLTENNTNTTRANLIELARDLLLSNFIISKIESLENSMCFCFCLLLLLLPLLAHRH